MNQDEQPPKPEDIGETTRQSGLAYAAALALFAAIVVMLGAGYLVDLWLNSTPWGIVGGIVFGSIIGLYQFVKISSRLK